MQTVSEILEWPKILEHLESCCQTGYGRLLVNDDDLMLGDATTIEAEMNRVQETKTLIQRYGDTPLQEPPDIANTLQRLTKNGEIQSAAELGELLSALKIMRQLARFFIQNRSREETPTLLETIESITLPNTAIELMENLVNDEGELRDSASIEYARLKGRIRELQTSIKQYLQNMISRPPVSRYLQEPIVTERDGRSVLPVRAEHKVDVPGIVHGASATGVTFYIEPKGVVDMNNRLIATRNDLEREIRRILKVVSEQLHPEAEIMMTFVSQTARLDLLMAKARQSLLFKANPVGLMEEPGTLTLKQARHPLLVLQPIEVVANDILLEPPTKVMIITGPNTGGKTVMLKLVGLFALMSRAGLHLPVNEGSAMSLFQPVLADVGDPQSITQNLSTFSGHMARLRAFLEEPDLSRALILIDEICAGTDPQEGASLAQALLEVFYRRGATVLVTTHIGELKVLAHQHLDYANASVEFDSETLSPTYRLILGVPGTSNALNIAARLGIPRDIIELARGNLSQPASDSARLIESLEAKNRQLAKELEEATRLRAEVQWEEEQIRKQLDRLEGEKKRTLQMFRETLRDKLRFIEREVDDLKQAVRDTEKIDPQDVQRLTGRFRKIQSQTGEFFTEETQKLYPEAGLDWDTLKVGDTVESRSLNMTATIVEKHPTRQEVTLQAGILKTVVPLSDLIRVVDKQQPAKSKKKGGDDDKIGSSKVHLQPKTLSLECDVRGMTVEDAIGIFDKFLDDALVSGVSTIGVIHGLGTGALKKAIRSHLKEIPFIKNFGPAPANDGGDGKTIIEL